MGGGVWRGEGVFESVWYVVKLCLRFLIDLARFSSLWISEYFKVGLRAFSLVGSFCEPSTWGMCLSSTSSLDFSRSMTMSQERLLQVLCPNPCHYSFCLVLGVRLREPVCPPCPFILGLMSLSSSALLQPPAAPGWFEVWLVSLLLPCIQASALPMLLDLRENGSVHLPCLPTVLVRPMEKNCG